MVMTSISTRVPRRVIARCGDGVIQMGIETCDDGNQNGGDGCEPDCSRTASFWNLIYQAEPPPRAFHAMAYDPASRHVVLFGGMSGQPCGPGTTLGDMWRWNGFEWVEVPGVGPSPRQGAVFARDSVRGGLILYGGVDLCAEGGPVSYDETWHWDGAAWTRLDPQTTPGLRTDFAMTHDEVSQQTYLFGPSAAGTSETFRWDGENWHLMAAHQQPPVPSGAQLIEHPIDDSIVLLTGDMNLWRLGADAWQELGPADGLNDRNGAVWVKDRTRAEVLLMGGVTGQMILDEAWYWNGLTWTEAAIQAGRAARYGHGLAYDESQRNIVLFGGVTDRGVVSETLIRR